MDDSLGWIFRRVESSLPACSTTTSSRSSSCAVFGSSGMSRQPETVKSMPAKTVPQKMRNPLTKPAAFFRGVR